MSKLELICEGLTKLSHLHVNSKSNGASIKGEFCTESLKGRKERKSAKKINMQLTFPLLPRMYSRLAEKLCF